MSLEQQIADLTSANMKLTAEVLKTKGMAETKAAEAANSASNASDFELDASQHKLAAESAETAATQKAAAAQQSEQNAAAVVTGGTATFDPEAGKIPLADSEGLIDNGWMLPVPSRAEFEARQEINRKMYSGSGFVDFALHRKNASVGFGDPINEGMWAYSSQSNTLRMGVADGATNVFGVSKRRNPIVNVDGVIIGLEGVNISTGEYSILQMPPAPLAINLVTDANFSSRVDVAATVDAGNIKKVLSISCKKGHTHLLEFEALAQNGTVYTATSANFGDVVDTVKPNGSAIGRYSHEFEATEESMYVLFYQNGDVVGADDASYDNISVVDMADVERADFVFLETWHEKISDKDVAYPFGNVQYGANSWEAIGLDDTLVAQGYSAFGDWDEDTKGYAARWSALTAAQKHAIVSEPLNNIYSDSGELIQVRYRVRVVKGVGSHMYRSEPLISKSSDNQFLTYQKNPGGSVKSTIRARGKLDGTYGDHTGVSSTSFSCLDRVVQHSGHFRLCEWKSGEGWTASDSNSYAHRGACFAVPIALVSRRNQGAYHPVFNPNGCERFKSSSKAGGVHWFSGAGLNHQPSSLMDCFDFGAFGADTVVAPQGFYGSVGGGGGAYKDARPDEKLADAVSASDVQDLRNNAAKVTDLSRTLNREFQRAVAGELRGSEKPRRVVGVWPITSSYAWQSQQVLTATGTGNSLGQEAHEMYIAITSAGVQYLKYNAWDGLQDKHRFVLVPQYKSISQSYQDLPDTGWLIKVEDTDQKSSGEILCCDIIGDPANYPQAWKDHGVFGAPLLAHPDTGASLIPDGTSKEFKASRKIESVHTALYSNDNGNTWTEFTNSTGVGNLHFNAANSPPTGRIYVLFYTAKASGWESADNAEVLATGKAYGLNSNQVARGNTLGALINKVMTSDQVGYLGSFEGVSGYYSTSYSPRFYFGMHTGAKPAHAPFKMNTDANSPAVKVFPYLTREDGRLYLQALFKEMKFDVDWGDDGKFDVVDGVVTVTDDNGNTVLAGQKRIALPFFISDEV